MNGTCDICKRENVQVFYTFGKYKCKECLEKSKTGKKGNSGMVYSKNVNEDYYKVSDTSLHIASVKKSDKLFVKWFIEHYPQSKGIVGRSLNYMVYNEGKPIGIIGFASPPLNYKKFNEFFNFSEDDKASESSKLFLNNNVYRLVHTDKNIGTQVLRMAREQVFKDYKQRYGDTLLGLVTFVERPRTGSMYKADNWEVLGETQGIEVKRRGKNWTEKAFIQTENKKIIFGYKYKDKFVRKVLNNLSSETAEKENVWGF